MEWDKKGIPWYGFDLDGTLANLDIEFVSPTFIGAPVGEMVDLIKSFHDNDILVKIFTARVSKGWLDYVGKKEAALVMPAIEDWCLKHLGFLPDITAEKDHLMVALFDDISLYQVDRNRGLRK